MTVHKLGDLVVGCGKCGSENTKFHSSLGDDAPIHCADCNAFLGNVGTMRNLATTMAREKVVPEVAAQLRKSLEGIFKK